jgi:hypothetical protein
MDTNTRHADNTMSIEDEPAERVTRSEAMYRLGVSHTTLARYIADGTLPVIRATVGRRCWILASEVERVRRARLGLDQ